MVTWRAVGSLHGSLHRSYYHSLNLFVRKNADFLGGPFISGDQHVEHSNTEKAAFSHSDCATAMCYASTPVVLIRLSSFTVAGPTLPDPATYLRYAVPCLPTLSPNLPLLVLYCTLSKQSDLGPRSHQHHTPCLLCNVQLVAAAFAKLYERKVQSRHHTAFLRLSALMYN